MSDEVDVKVSIAKIEQSIEHLTETLKEQKELLNTLLLDSQKRNDSAKENMILSEVARKRQEEQIDSVKYTVRIVQDRIDSLHDDLRSFKNDSNAKQDQMQLELDNFNSKVDDNWLFIIKVIALVLAGAVLGAGAVSTGLKGWLGI